MKGKEIIAHAVRAEMPDMEQLRKNSIRQATEKGTKKYNAWVKRIAAATACIAVVLAVVIAFPHLVNNDINTSSINAQLIDSAIRGLPVENFNLADVENDSIAMDRMAYTDFASLFWRGVDCFAIVKVSNIQTTKENQQISDVMILQSIYGECEANAIQITQHIIKNHFCLGTTNLLRKGGNYLLPLKQSDGKWYVTGDMDVLFEIDDKGKVWSHSDFEDFNCYDGKSIDELKNIFSDDDFMLASSPFSDVLRGWTLADIKITSSKKDGTDIYNQPCFSYEFAVNEIFFDPNHENSAPLGKIGAITVYADETDPIELIDGERYLICLDRYEGEIYINSRMIAQIGNDDAITAILSIIGENVFTPYNGYKISDIREMVLRIEEWHKAQR